MTYDISVRNKVVELYNDHSQITISRIIIALNKELGVAPSSDWIKSVIRKNASTNKSTTKSISRPVGFKKVSKKIYAKKIPTCISLTHEVSSMLNELAEKYKSSKSDIINNLFSEKYNKVKNVK